ncbi:MAG TPA: M3 family metallopeptidase, partial [Labilithrix sp.]
IARFAFGERLAALAGCALVFGAIDGVPGVERSSEGRALPTVRCGSSSDPVRVRAARAGGRLQRMQQSENPLLAIAVPIPFDTVDAAQIGPAIDRLLEDAKKRVDAIAAAPRTYERTLGALDVATSELDYATNIASHLESVIGTQALRDAWAAVLPRVSEFGTRLLLDEPLYRALREFAETEEAKRLDPARMRFLRKTLADFRRNGAELDAGGKTRLAEIDVALSELTLQFSQNVVDSIGAFEYVVDDRARLGGLPEGAIDAARKAAEDKNKGGWRFTLQAPSYGPVLAFADDRAMREALYRANVTRAVTGKEDNRPVIVKILELRREKAKLLGFAHFADLVIDDRMAKSGKHALAFVSDLASRLKSAGELEDAELEAFARAGGHQGRLEPWDTSYWAERQRRARYDFDDETLRPYFPLDRVTRGLFELAESLYGVRIERDPAARTWHPDVTAWAVTNEKGARIGGFYFDLYPREKKGAGAWMGGMVDRLPGTRQERENVAVIVANITPPSSSGRPALLNHREVETLFHEFGHMMHHVLSEVSIRSLAGTRVVSDFVELPSMIMENWCWERDALDRFARHWETGAPIPDDVKDRMLRA